MGRSVAMAAVWRPSCPLTTVLEARGANAPPAILRARHAAAETDCRLGRGPRGFRLTCIFIFTKRSVVPGFERPRLLSPAAAAPGRFSSRLDTGYGILGGIGDEDSEMRFEVLPGLTNVIRFPVELRERPSLEVLREIAPDVREVLAIAEAFGLEAPVHDLRGQVDVETAAHIAAHIPLSDPPAVREAGLAAMIEPLVAAAIDACREAHDLSAEAAEAQQAFRLAERSGGYWLEPLRDRAETLTERAVTLLVAAHARVEETEGVARAVDFARHGEPWAPRDHDAETDALLAYREIG